MLAAELLRGKDERMFKDEKKKEVVKSVANSNNSGVMRNKYGTGVRSYLVNSGLDNEKIGYRDGMVTYNGKDVLQPNIVVDGRSYADESALRELAMDLHKSEGRDLVSATDYAAEMTGIKNAASVDNGYVSVGDKTMKAKVASDGTAYLPREDMEAALESYKEKTGYKSENDIYNNWAMGEGAKIRRALMDILEDDWSYSPENDPAYKAYADMYRREGERAFSDAFGNAIAGTDGQVNSMAVTAAAQGLDNYMQKLSDKIPELMNADFERFSNMQEKRLKAVDELMGIYDKEYSANSDYLKRLNEANMQNYEQKVAGDDAEIAERLAENELFNGYIDSEKSLIELEYLPQVYESDLNGDRLSQALDAIEFEYTPKLYDSELYSEALKQALDELELYYAPKIYDAELSEIEKENKLRDLEARYYVGQHLK